jgi:hypothetical protein
MGMTTQITEHLSGYTLTRQLFVRWTSSQMGRNPRTSMVDQASGPSVASFIETLHLIRRKLLEARRTSHEAPGAPCAQPFGPGPVLQHGDDFAAHHAMIPATGAHSDAIRRSDAQLQSCQRASGVHSGALNQSDHIRSNAPCEDQPACGIGCWDVRSARLYVPPGARWNGVKGHVNQVRAALRSITAQHQILGNACGIDRVGRATLPAGHRAITVDYPLGCYDSRLSDEGLAWTCGLLAVALRWWPIRSPASGVDRWHRDER